MPEDTIPIFSDKFDHLDPDNKEKLTKVYSFDEEDYILKAASKHMNPSDFLDLNEIDCIYGSKFSMMIPYRTTGAKFGMRELDHDTRHHNFI